MPKSHATSVTPRPGEAVARSPKQAFLVIFFLSFAIRSALLLSGMTPRQFIFPETATETGAVAKTLFETGAYADPYLIPTGPTAHPQPLYTGMITLIYHLFGVTLTAGYVRCFLCIACFSAMYAMIPWFACRIGADWQGGALGGLVGAVIPQQSLGELIGWSVNEPLAAIALALLLAGFLRRWREADHLFLRALLFGMGWGVAFHFSPALLLVMLAGLAFELWWSKSRRKWLSSLLVVLGATLACLPWTWRNYAAFHEFFFIRSNLGLELRVGNHPGAAPAMEVMDAREGDRMRHPGNNRAEAVKVRELGEREYMRQAQSEAWDWISAHPAEFLRLTAARVMHFWFGPLHQPLVAAGISLLTILAAVGAGRALPAWTPPQRAALLIPLATFPLVYYVVAYMSRYAVPVNWLLLMLAGNEVWYWIKRGGAPNNS